MPDQSIEVEMQIVGYCSVFIIYLLGVAQTLSHESAIALVHRRCLICEAQQKKLLVAMFE